MKPWHLWRIKILKKKLHAQQTVCALLEKAERDYGSSYYTNRLVEASRVRAEIEADLEHHQGKLTKP